MRLLFGVFIVLSLRTPYHHVLFYFSMFSSHMFRIVFCYQEKKKVYTLMYVRVCVSKCNICPDALHAAAYKKM